MALRRASVEITVVLCCLTMGRFSSGMPYEETNKKSQYYIPSEEEADILRENLLEALGLKRIPDVSKMNVSSEEYNRAFAEYLKRVEEDNDVEENRDSDFKVLKLFPLTSERVQAQHRHHHVEDYFTFIVPSEVLSSRISSVEFQMEFSKFQESPKHRFRILQKEESQKMLLYSAAAPPSQVNIDVTEKLKISEKIQLYILCSHCSADSASISIKYSPVHRSKRSQMERVLSLPKEKGRTDCTKGKNKKEKRCCRHQMKVSFRDLGFGFIIAPDEFDAYLCGGSCPSQYNPAHNHALLQFMLHTKDRKLAPKPCCAPAKLKHLEILHMNENQNLTVTKWKNVIVTECACS